MAEQCVGRGAADRVVSEVSIDLRRPGQRQHSLMEIDLTLAEFKLLVSKHEREFAGVHPHADHEFDDFERALGCSLPPSLRWLLSTRGYSECCGIGNLAEAVEQTIECRTSIGLPNNWLLLNDWGDGGIVLLDLTSGRVCWCGSHNAGNLRDGRIDSDADWFDGYAEWAVSRLEAAD